MTTPDQVDLSLLPPGWERASLPERYEAAKAALALCSQVDECRKWESWAYAAAAYARMAHDDALERMARQIRLRAVRRLGELIEAQKASVGLNQGTAGTGDSNVGRAATGGNRQLPPVDERPTLAEAGIPKMLSSRSQAIASLPRKDFEAAVESASPPSASRLAEMARPSKPAITPRATPDPFRDDIALILEAADRLRQRAERADPDHATAWGAMVSSVIGKLQATRHVLAEASGGKAVVLDIREGRRHG